MSQSNDNLDDTLNSVSNWVERCADERKKLVQHLDNLRRAKEII